MVKGIGKVTLRSKFGSYSSLLQAANGSGNLLGNIMRWNWPGTDFGNQFPALEFHFKIITALRISRLQWQCGCGNPLSRKYCGCYFSLFQVPIISIYKCIIPIKIWPEQLFKELSLVKTVFCCRESFLKVFNKMILFSNWTKL